MALIPDNEETTVSKIYKSYEARSDNGFREHLGASIIGKECERELWYSFRWATPASFTGRILRLFKTGLLQEERLAADLRAAGCTVYTLDPKSGKQFRLVAHGGHFGGSMDGCVIGLVEAPKTWHVLEFKSYNTKRFSKLTNDGVKKADYHYYAQLQVYMGLSGMERACFLAWEKDTDELYMERVHFDTKEFDKLMEKAERVIFTDTPPPKVSSTPGYMACKFCPMKDVCWDDKMPALNCRTCVHATVEKNGSWSCALLKKTLSIEEQRRGCAKHLYLPGLVPHEQVDAGEDFIEYKNKAGMTMRNMAGGKWK